MVKKSAKPCLKEKPEGAIEVPGYPGTFVTPGVSVYSFGRPGSNGEEGYRLRALSPDDKGYLKLVVRVRGKPVTRRVHFLVCTAFHGEKPFPGAEVRHLDGVIENCSESNLIWGTAQENVADRHAHGSYVKHSGTGNHLSRLNDDQVIEIRRLAAAGTPPYELVEIFKIAKETLRDIVYGRSWRHLLPSKWLPPPRLKGGTPAHRPPPARQPR